MDPSGELSVAPVVATISPSVKYYRKNRDAILAREKTKKRWLDYYARNKEAVNARQREAYARRKEIGLTAVSFPSP